MVTKKEIIIATIIAVILTGFFFYKTITRGLVPVPVDVLVNEYQPWRSTSYIGYAPAAFPHKAQYPDTVRQIYPWKTLVIESYKEGKLPLWNPYNFSGSPLLANFQSQALYPLNLVYMLFSHIDAWSALVALQPLLAGLFTYLYGRKIGIGIFGSFLSAVSYGASGFMAVWLQYNTVGHVILWLPLMLLCIENLPKNPGRWILILALSHAFALLAGHPQVYGYTLIFSLVYLWLRHKSRHIKIVGTLTSVIGIGLAGLQLIPGIELIQNAARSPHEFDQLFSKILIQPWQLIATAFPNFFGNPATRTYWPLDTFIGKVTTIGLVPFFFLLAIFRRPEPIVRWFLWATIAIVVLLTANPLSWLLYQLPLPVISASSPTLMGFLFAFCLSILAGFGLDHWIVEKHSVKKLVKRSLQTMALLGVLFIATYTPWISPHTYVAQRALLYGSLIAASILGLFWLAITKPKFMSVAVGGMLFIHVIDLIIFFNRFNPFVPKALVYPTHDVTALLESHNDTRYWGYGTAAIPANLSSQFHALSPEGYDPLYPRWYGEFLYAYREGKLLETFSNNTRSDAAIVSGFGESGMSDQRKNKILQALSVGLILDRTENGSTQKTFPSPQYQTTYKANDWTVFTDTKAAPRVYLADNIISYTNKDDFAEKFFSDLYVPGKSILLDHLPSTVDPTSTPGEAKITAMDSDQITIQTIASRAKVLVLTDTYYPGWHATVDGRPVDILKANWTQRGIVVPAGPHEIIMYYKPHSVKIGLYVTLTSLVALVCIIIVVQRRKRIS